MTQPLAIDLFCGLGGWTEGLLAEGYRVVGFDNARHVYGEARYPAQLVIQDVLTLHGAQFKDAALIVASPPCQAYSYRAMPWKKAKALPPPDNTLFEACFRIQQEANDVSDHFIPLVVENVCGAQTWVGRARWHYGSFYLWGDVPALMPTTTKRKQAGNFHQNGNGVWNRGEHIGEGVKVATMGAGWYPPEHPKHVRGLAFNGHADRNLRATKNDGGSWFNIAHNTTSGHGQNPVNGVKGSDGYERDHPAAFGWKKPNTLSHSTARKAASAHIAKIPFALSSWIARAWKP